MRWMLLVDTCGMQGSVGLADLRGTPHIAVDRTLPGRETQERLTSAMNEVLAEAAVELQAVDVLGVVTGPGSFTGVRIGIATLKGFAEALGRPALAVSRLAVLAAKAGTDGTAQAWIDAGRGDVFVGRYRAGVCLDERLMRGGEATHAVPPSEPVIIMEEQLARFYPAAVLVPAVGIRDALPLAVVKLGARMFSDVALMDANYLRVPDAELARTRPGDADDAPPGVRR